MSDSVSCVSAYTFSYSLPSIDAEEEEIMRRLLAYGETPVGNKTIDKAKLHRIEEHKAKEENIVTPKYLTVSTNEQEKIQERKKERRKTDNPELDNKIQDKRVGAKLLGDQIYFAIKMKQTGFASDAEEKDELKIDGDYVLSKEKSFNQHRG